MVSSASGSVSLLSQDFRLDISVGSIVGNSTGVEWMLHFTDNSASASAGNQFRGCFRFFIIIFFLFWKFPVPCCKRNWCWGCCWIRGIQQRTATGDLDFLFGQPSASETNSYRRKNEMLALIHSANCCAILNQSRAVNLDVCYVV